MLFMKLIINALGIEPNYPFLEEKIKAESPPERPNNQTIRYIKKAKMESKEIIKELTHICHEESQQDWLDLGYKEIWEEGFSECIKYVGKLLESNQPKEGGKEDNQITEDEIKVQAEKENPNWSWKALEANNYWGFIKGAKWAISQQNNRKE